VSLLRAIHTKSFPYFPARGHNYLHRKCSCLTDQWP
jgi:hypothetical protein